LGCWGVIAKAESARASASGPAAVGAARPRRTLAHTRADTPPDPGETDPGCPGETPSPSPADPSPSDTASGGQDEPDDPCAPEESAAV
ncbi:hypothetical protein JS521_17990, partial [Streptomyces sp. RHZ10]|nr:hypothetical protein [Streptomyces durocortorensis]